MMNNPKRSEAAPLIRKLIAAPEGWKLLAIDESQSELRWAAHVANDANMIKIFKTKGADIHTETGKDLSGGPSAWKEADQKERDKARFRAKAVNFGLLFGMSINGFIKYAKTDYGIDLSRDQAEDWVTIFFRKFSRLRAYHKRAVEDCRRKGYVESPLGRRRRLPEIYSDEKWLRLEAERQAINHPVQSPSSDTVLIALNQLLGRSPLNPNIMKSSVGDIVRGMKWDYTGEYGLLHPQLCFPVMFIHDEIVFQIKDDPKVIDKYARIIKFEMENPPLERDFGVKLKVPLVADPAIGSNLAEMKEIKL